MNSYLDTSNDGYYPISTPLTAQATLTRPATEKAVACIFRGTTAPNDD